MSSIGTVEASPRPAEVFSITQAPRWITSKAKTAAAREDSIAALSMEFVAVPAAAQALRDTVASDMEAAFRDVTGYAGCLVLASFEEARLITVITLWSGAERRKFCSENARWVRGLLSPYVDRWLRTRTLTTSIRAAQMLTACAIP